MTRRIGTNSQVQPPVSTGTPSLGTTSNKNASAAQVEKKEKAEGNSFVTGEHRGLLPPDGGVAPGQPKVLRPSDILFSSIDSVRDSFERYDNDESLSPEVFWNTNAPIDGEWKVGREVAADRTTGPGGTATSVTHTERNGLSSVERARDNGISLPEEDNRGAWTRPVSVTLAQWWVGESKGSGYRNVKSASTKGSAGEASAQSTLYSEVRKNYGAGGRITPYGAEGGTWARARVVAAGVQVKGEIKSQSAHIAGRDVNVSLGAKVQPFVGAEASSFGWVEVNARQPKASIDFGAGVFAGAKARANVDFGVKDGELLKLRATAEGWAGVGADAGVSVGFSKGRFSLGASAGVGLGIGGKVGFEVEIDVVETGKMAAKLGYQAIDRDGDGSISLNDAAAGTSQAMNLGAAAVEKGADGLIAALDGDGDGKFSLFDLQVRANQAGTAVKDGATALGRGLKSGAEATAQGVKSALDRDGDGSLTTADVSAGLEQAGNAIKGAAESVRDFGKQVGSVSAALGRGTVADLKDVGSGLKVGAQRLGENLHQAADIDGNGKLEFNDVRVAGQQVGRAVSGAASATVNAVKDGAEAIAQGTQQAADAVVDAAQATASAIKDGAVAAGQSIHDGLDRDGDGKLTFQDARHGVSEVGKALSQAGKAGVNAVKSGAQAVGQGVQALGEGIQATGRGLHRAADRDGDGSLSLNDVAVGAQQAGQAIRDGATALGEGVVAAGQAVRDAGQSIATGAKELAQAAKTELQTAGTTIKDGAVEAYQRTKAAVQRVAEFMGFND